MTAYRLIESLRTNQLRRAGLCVALALASLTLLALDIGPVGLVFAVVGQLGALTLLPFRRPGYHG